MDLLPTDDPSRDAGLQTRDDQNGLSPTPTGSLAKAELEDLLARGNSGDPDALEILKHHFGARNCPGAFRRLLFRSIAKGGLGAHSYWDHWNAQAEFERIEEAICPKDATPTQKLIAETAAFSYVHNHLAHRRLYDIQFDCKVNSPDRALRDQSANAANATLSFIRLMREVERFQDQS